MPLWRILLVEPDPARRRAITVALERSGVGRVVGRWGDFAQAVEHTGPETIDVAILNLEAAVDVKAWARLRLAHPRVQIVGLTTGQDAQTLLRAVAAGVTALLPAPLAPQALIRLLPQALTRGRYIHPALEGRVRLALSPPLSGEALRLGPLSLDLAGRVAALHGRPIRLSPLEFDVLAYLALAGRPVSTEELLEAVWGTPLGEGGSREQVWQCIRRLRRKLEADPAHPRLLRTLRGQGYVLAASGEAEPRARQGLSGPSTLLWPMMKAEREEKSSGPEGLPEVGKMKRSRLVRAAAGVVGLVLVGLLAFGLSRLSPLLTPQAEQPVWEPGTFWRYECTAAEPALVREWTREELVLGEVSEKGVNLYLTLRRSHFGERPLVEIDLYDQRTLLATPVEFLDQVGEYAWLDFPLRVGKRWSAGPDTTAEVVALERLDLPIGQVAAHRIEFRDAEGETRVVWYAEKVENMVRARSPEGECTLTAWGRKDLQQALEPFFADLERMAKSQPAEAWVVVFTLDRYGLAAEEVRSLKSRLISDPSGRPPRYLLGAEEAGVEARFLLIPRPSPCMLWYLTLPPKCATKWTVATSEGSVIPWNGR